MRPVRLFPPICLLLLAVILLAGCSAMNPASDGAKPYVTVPTAGSELVKRYAPAFLIQYPQKEHNLIGQPKARLKGDQGDEEIYVDPKSPLIYYETRRFWTPKGWYQNLVYRVHFQGTPFALLPFYLGWGDNNGVMVVVTLDQFDMPVLVSTVGTCGCYVSFTATNYTSEEMMPADWKKEAFSDVYGEKIPTVLDFKGYAIPRLLVTLGPDEHRIRGLEVQDGTKFKGDTEYKISKADLTPMEELKKLSLGDKTTSFYSEEWSSRGYVKGAFKPLEFLTLGLWALDYRVGQDKEYGNVHNPFYTSLQQWNQLESDMNEYPRFLEFHGWKP